jgi:hypothetical protein
VSNASIAHPQNPPKAIFASDTDFATWLNTVRCIFADAKGTPCGEPTSWVEWTAWDDPDFGASDIYEVALFCDELQDPSHVEALVAYFAKGPFAGEYGPAPATSPKLPFFENRLFLFSVDFTKSRRDDVYDALPALWEILRDGTPVRKTDRAGAGTKGTRKHQGIQGPFCLAFK